MSRTLIIHIMIFLQMLHICNCGYHFSGYNTRKTWQDANAYCGQQYGSTLATVVSEADKQALKDAYVSDAVWDQNGAGDIWVGLSDLTQEGKFVWINGYDCDDVVNGCTNQDFWRAGEPNGGNDNDCVAIQGARDVAITDLFNDNRCAATIPFFCNAASTPSSSCLFKIGATNGECGLVGSKYSGYFHDNFNYFDGKTPLTVETFSKLQFSLGEDNYSFKFEGFFIPDKTATYSFFLRSDDASHLFIDGNHVVNVGGTHGPITRSGTLAATACQKYAVTIYFGELGGGDYLEFYWTVNGVRGDLLDTPTTACATSTVRKYMSGGDLCIKYPCSGANAFWALQNCLQYLNTEPAIIESAADLAEISAEMIGIWGVRLGLHYYPDENKWNFETADSSASGWLTGTVEANAFVQSLWAAGQPDLGQGNDVWLYMDGNEKKMKSGAGRAATHYLCNAPIYPDCLFDGYLPATTNHYPNGFDMALSDSERQFYGSSVDLCAAWCRSMYADFKQGSTPGCAGYTYDKVNKMCHPKHSFSYLSYGINPALIPSTDHLSGGRFCYPDEEIALIGCYTDNGERALNDHEIGRSHTPLSCHAACAGYQYFAVQDGDWCVCENSRADATRYGATTGCVDGRGAAWKNSVYLNVDYRNYAEAGPQAYVSYDWRSGSLVIGGSAAPSSVQLSAGGGSVNVNVGPGGGYLDCPGGGNWLKSGLITESFTEKTMTVYVQLDKTSQAGAGTFGMETPGGQYFDTIVWGERGPVQNKKWIAGSDGWVRSNDMQSAAAEDNLNWHIITIRYSAPNVIKMWIDGQVYGDQYSTGNLWTFTANGFYFHFCKRHDNVGNGWFDGKIKYADIHDSALTDAEIASKFNGLNTDGLISSAHGVFEWMDNNMHFDVDPRRADRYGIWLMAIVVCLFVLSISLCWWNIQRYCKVKETKYQKVSFVSESEC